MIYLGTASNQPARDAMAAGLLGQLRQPWGGQSLQPGTVWAADNGCFQPDKFKVVEWLEWLDRQPRTALWATVPDMVGDPVGTAERWELHAGQVRSLGFRPAFVAQDGLLPAEIPHNASAVFIGGSTEWKLSTAARAIVDEAHRRELPTHMGRVNSRQRLRLAYEWGVDTVDGTFLAFGPDKNLPVLLRWLDQIRTQGVLWD